MAEAVKNILEMVSFHSVSLAESYLTVCALLILGWKRVFFMVKAIHFASRIRLSLNSL